MKLSTKSTYGLRAMLNVAISGGSEAISISDISEREGISTAYLEQLLNKLRHSGFIESVRGPRGGYVLAKKAADITVADIVGALERSVYPVHCATNRKKNVSCKRSRSCVPKMVWHKLSKAINDCLKSITLADLCREADKVG